MKTTHIKGRRLTTPTHQTRVPLLNSGIYCKEWDIRDDVWSLANSLHRRFLDRLDILVNPCEDS